MPREGEKYRREDPERVKRETKPGKDHDE